MPAHPGSADSSTNSVVASFPCIRAQSAIAQNPNQSKFNFEIRFSARACICCARTVAFGRFFCWESGVGAIVAAVDVLFRASLPCAEDMSNAHELVIYTFELMHAMSGDSNSNARNFQQNPTKPGTIDWPPTTDAACLPMNHASA
eukprot:2599966-Rhodomonas_salina.1